MRDVVIIGVGMTRFGKWLDHSLGDLGQEAVWNAVEDANVPPKDIQIAYVANAMATSVGSRALTVKKAIVIAAVFEFCGAFLAGGQVTTTIRKGIVDAAAFAGNLQ